MKNHHLQLIIAGIVGVALLCLFSQDASKLGCQGKARPSLIEKQEKPGKSYLAMQADYQFIKLMDPHTGQIPKGIRACELAFVSRMPLHPDGEGHSWKWRGYWNYSNNF